jgi:hypothetical protein
LLALGLMLFVSGCPQTTTATGSSTATPTKTSIFDRASDSIIQNPSPTQKKDR